MHLIGPPLEGPIVPADDRGLSPANRRTRIEELLEAVAGDRGKPPQHLQLARLYWLEKEYDNALRYFERDPGNLKRPEVLYSIGLVHRAKGLAGGARTYWRQCAREFPNSLWQIYANESQRKL